MVLHEKAVKSMLTAHSTNSDARWTYQQVTLSSVVDILMKSAYLQEIQTTYILYSSMMRLLISK
jgi:hypothetical protein